MLQKLLNNVPILFYGEGKHLTSLCKSCLILPIIKKMMLWIFDGCEKIFFQISSMLSECSESIKFLLENDVLVSLPKSSLSLSENSHFVYVDIIMLKSFTPICHDNNISDGFDEVFNSIVETMDYVDLKSFSDKDAGEIVFLLNLSVITKEDIECNNNAVKLKGFKNMLLIYEISCHEICDKLTDFFASDPDLTLSTFSVYKIISDTILSFFIGLDPIFTGLTWEHRRYIYWALCNDSNHGFER